MLDGGQIWDQLRVIRSLRSAAVFGVRMDCYLRVELVGGCRGQGGV